MPDVGQRSLPLPAPPGSAAQVSRLDAALLWHPYSSFAGAQRPRVVSSAAGAALQFADGTSVVDGMSSWWAAIHGYRHPVLDAALHKQIAAMSHVMFGGLTHQPAAELGDLLTTVTGMDRVFFCRLRVGVGGGGSENGAAVLARPRPADKAALTYLARRLSR